uniref:Fibrinogen alpha chain n=1 Tax=Varanus komodoensis TaxID=61221 RepID=A0A8D2IUN1_VARKO
MFQIRVFCLLLCFSITQGTKCPSGCRMQGLIHEMDQDFTDRIAKIKKLLSDNQESYKSSNILKQEITTILERNLVDEQRLDESYGQTTDDLRRRIVTLKQRVVNHVNRIKSMQSTIENQVGEIKRLEVDIDIKLRGCKGSCARVPNYNVDMGSYDTIQKQLVQTKSINIQSELESKPLKVLKIRPLKDSVPSHFKTGPLSQQEARVLDYIKVMEVVVEDSGLESRGSPVVVSRPETAGQPHTGKLVTTTTTDEGGSSDIRIVRPGTHTLTCIKTITKKVIQGPDGTREEIAEHYRTPEGGECSHTGDFEKGAGGSTYYSKLTTGGSAVGGNVGGGGSGLPDLSSLHPDAKEFFSSASGGRVHTLETHHSTGTVGRPDFSDLGEGEEEDLSRFDHSSPVFEPMASGGSTHSKTAVSGGSTYSRTVVSGSSSSSAFNKGGSTFETKSIKIPLLQGELEGVLHDQSGEDNPDFRARSSNTGGVKQGESSIRTDCEDIRQKHTSGTRSGLFKIKPAGSSKGFSVYCDQETTLGGWLLIQQRLDGSLNFNRTWDDYKKGFGNVDGKGKGEFWLGNENLHMLTQKDSVLRVELEDWEGNEAYAEYNVQIGSESEGYKLIISNYEGTAGDALIKGSEEGGSQYTAHANMTFSTFDRDSDQWEENCAEMYGGGWWYNNCQAANLNGMYHSGGQYDPRNNVPYEIENGVIWVPFRPSDYSLKTVRMKIRPVETE